MVTVLVTGAAGFIGYELCKELRKAYPDARIIGLLRDKKSENLLIAEGVEPLVCDLQDIAKCRELLLEANYVFHVGGEARFGNSFNYTDVNIHPTRELTEILAASKNLKRIVFTSTIGAVDRSTTDSCDKLLNVKNKPCPQSEYGRSKLTCEKILEESSLPYTILRLSWVYGLSMRATSHIAVLLDNAKRGSLSSLFHFPGKVSTVFVEDLTRAMVVATTNKETYRKTYFVSDGQPIAIGDILSIGRDTASRSSPYEIDQKITAFIRKCRTVLPFTVRCLFEDVLTCEPELFNVLGIQPSTTAVGGIRKLSQQIDKRNHEGVIIVTGAASGIGLEISKILSEEGSKLVLVDIDSSLSQKAYTLQQDYLQINLIEPDASQKLKSYVGERFVKGLINCAGIGFKGYLHEHTESKIAAIFNLNTITPILLTRAFLPQMLKSNFGFIINIASSIATTPLPQMCIYGASKAALYSFGRSLVGELYGTRVQCLTVLPGGTKTNFQKSSGVLFLRDGEGLLCPHKVAEVIVSSIKKDSPILRIGISSRIFGFLSRILPNRLEIYLWNYMMRKFR
jgi:uncharacterized protein